jgi:formyltetrahydrofolate deformylase
VQDTDDNKTIIELTVIGKDRKGVVASFTNVIFSSGGNIESLSQDVVRGLFGMHLEASFLGSLDEAELKKKLLGLGKRFGMDVGVHYQERGREMNLAVMVTKESHVLKGILTAVRRHKLKVKVPLVLGSEKTLQRMAEDFGVPFFSVESPDTEKREARILDLLQEYNIDGIALARYMRVLSPNFVWRYPNKIINIHPSILPAFPGASAYEQALEKGARIMGCTAHFLTTGLDEGPIIWQEAFRADPKDTLESIKKKGRELEIVALVKALQLFADGKLEVRWGRVYING